MFTPPKSIHIVMVFLSFQIIFTVFTNLTNFNVLLSVSLVCIELDNYFYKSNKIQKYSDHFSIISSYFDGLFFSVSVVWIELKNNFHNLYKSNKLQKTSVLPVKISSYFNGLLISVSLVRLELTNNVHNLYKSHNLQSYSHQCFFSLYRMYRIGKWFFTNLTNFEHPVFIPPKFPSYFYGLLVSVSLVCIELENIVYKSNKLWKPSFS